MPKPVNLFLLAAMPLALSTVGCHLIDQRDFDAAAGRPPALPVVPATAPATAPTLVTIRYATPDPQYREALTGIVQRALARKPDVLFVVTTLTPGQLLADAVGSGREVAQAIVDAGAAPGQVEQTVREQPGLTVKEIRVTVHQ